MDLYVIIRRNGWASAQELETAAARSSAEGDKADSGVRWIRSYVLAEDSGELGTTTPPTTAGRRRRSRPRSSSAAPAASRAPRSRA